MIFNMLQVIIIQHQADYVLLDLKKIKTKNLILANFYWDNFNMCNFTLFLFTMWGPSLSDYISCPNFLVIRNTFIGSFFLMIRLIIFWIISS